MYFNGEITSEEKKKSVDERVGKKLKLSELPAVLHRSSLLKA